MLEPANYDKISIDVYKEIYSEAKIKFEETKSRSEIITGRASQIIILVFGLSGWAATNFNSTKPIVFIFITLYILIMVFSLIKAINLFLKRRMPLRGTMPRAIYENKADLINPDHKADKVFYFQQINRYQEKIDRVEAENQDRGKKLQDCLIAATLLFIYTVIVFVCKQNSLL